MTSTAADDRQGWQRALPGLGRLRHYQRRWWRRDVLAGVTVAAYLVPQVMAYADVAGLPAVTGLWACIAALVVYALLGSSPQLSVGPESTTALMTAVALGGVAAGDPSRYAALASMLAVLVGVICVLARFVRLGFMADLLSRPVLVGYMAGVAVIMIASQLGTLTGVPTDATGITDEVVQVVTHLGDASVPTLVVGICVLVFLFVAHRVAPRAPVPLLAMLLGAAAVALLGLGDQGVATVGPIPTGYPAPDFSGLGTGDVAVLIPAAFGVAVVAFSDNVLTARAFAIRGHYRVDNNQELLALGGANMAAGLVQGFPVSSSGSRTAIGDAQGSSSQMYSLAAVVTVLAGMLLFGPVLAAFPTAALGAVVVYAATRLVDLPEFRRFARFRRAELVLAVSTTIAVLVLGVLTGVLVAVGLSVVDLLRRVTRPHDGILGYVPGLAGMHDVDDYPAATPVPGLVVYRYDSPLFFANAEDFRTRALGAVDIAEPPARWFLLNAEANISVDITALDALEDLRAELERRGVHFAMARVKQDLRDELARTDFLTRVGEENVFMTLPTAVEAYRKAQGDDQGGQPGARRSPAPR